LQDDAPCLLDVVAIPDTDVVFPAALRKRGVHEHRVRIQLAIRDDGATPVVGLDERGAGLDILDGPFVLLEPDLVAHAERARHENENAREKVLENVLEGEADRDATNAQRADEIRRREARERGRYTDEKPEDDDPHLRDPTDGQLQRASLATAHRVASNERARDFRDDDEQRHDRHGDEESRHGREEVSADPLYGLP